ncbi:lytic transglycosylase domain-containing protein, partial [bacterium]|nr:lytic transglycosylase domain-containing protein [bacterium]
FQNVMGGTRYLRQLLDRYDGNLRNTLAAYNWGPHRVDKYGTQRLPDETRGYLARIHGLLTHDRRTAANDLPPPVTFSTKNHVPEPIVSS